MIISCGAALDHLRVAFAGLGWWTEIDRCPDPASPHHLATVHVRETRAPTPQDVALWSAIAHRRSDRLPFPAPAESGIVDEMRAIAAEFATSLEAVTDRAALVAASERAAAERRYNQSYQDELHWWAGHSTMPEGVPREVLLSAHERARVDVGRRFPSTEHPPRRTAVTDDQATILALSTDRDSQPSWLRCGEALSAVLLACTVNGLATCPLSHVTELPGCRAAIADLTAGPGLPQVLVRVGAAGEPHPGRTDRRPVRDVLEFVD
jgi:hypothetical protein